jgi:transposase
LCYKVYCAELYVTNVSETMPSWQLTDKEWAQLGHLLEAFPTTGGRGHPRIADNRPAAQACLYRHFHAGSSGNRSFGWNNLPSSLGVSPSTANRRFREWSTSGAWQRFWHALLDLRRGKSHRSPEEWVTERATGRFPVGDVLSELERAYLFFNTRFFGSSLPSGIGLGVERKATERCQGYFCAKVWREKGRALGHIALHASAIEGGASAAMAVLLHEMVHLRNDQAGISDCHPANQYHNRYFRDLAVLAGLICGARDPARGYAYTELAEAGHQAVAELCPNEDLFHWKVR